MDTHPYSNREIDTLMKEIKEQLDRIEQQTIRTNGRVSLLERYQTGLVMTLSLLAFIVVPLTVYTFEVAQNNLKNEIINQLK